MLLDQTTGNLRAAASDPLHSQRERQWQLGRDHSHYHQGLDTAVDTGQPWEHPRGGAQITNLHFVFLIFNCKNMYVDEADHNCKKLAVKTISFFLEFSNPFFFIFATLSDDFSNLSIKHLTLK